MYFPVNTILRRIQEYLPYSFPVNTCLRRIQKLSTSKHQGPQNTLLVSLVKTPVPGKISVTTLGSYHHLGECWVVSVSPECENWVNNQLQCFLRWQIQDSDLWFISPVHPLYPPFDLAPSLILQINVYFMPLGTHCQWRFWYLVMSNIKCGPCSLHSKEILHTQNLKWNKQTKKKLLIAWACIMSLKMKGFPDSWPSTQSLKMVFSTLWTRASLSARAKQVLSPLQSELPGGGALGTHCLGVFW